MLGLTITLIITTWLYIRGDFRNLMKRCRLDTNPEEKPNISPRERLELEAGYILNRQGQNAATVRYMGDEMLEAITRDYLRGCEIL